MTRNSSSTRRWVLVTGAARRVGAAIARRLHAAGDNVVLHAHASLDERDALAAELSSARAGSVHTCQADLRDTRALGALVAGVIGTTGRLDALVNNASTFYPTPLESLNEAAWDDLIGTNLKAPLFLAAAAAPELGARQGSIVNIVDIHIERPLPQHAVYTVAKAGLAALTRSLARDLAPDVRVNAIAPGAVAWPEGMPDELRAHILGRIPLGRTGSPDDIARCAAYLIHDAGYVTGEIIAVDGGRLLNS